MICIQYFAVIGIIGSLFYLMYTIHKQDKKYGLYSEDK